MSSPIDIPGDRAKRPRTRSPGTYSYSSVADGPHFGYIETFESGDTKWMISAGNAKYVEVTPRHRLPPLCFIAHKDRTSKCITLEVISSLLRDSVRSCIFNSSPTEGLLELDFETILAHYDALKIHALVSEEQSHDEELSAELRLLIFDFLSERAVYEGIGFETFQNQGVLGTSLVQDVHHRTVSVGLDEIDRCFLPGQISDYDKDQYMETFNAQFTERALLGDLVGLQDICEPAVRAGEIEFQYNPDLLVDVLDNHSFDVFIYLLDLIDRTRDVGTESIDSRCPDIAFDPMYVAIRLGRIDTVRALVSENAFFEGTVGDREQVAGGHFFTPLSAAVFWDQEHIVRLLLKAGPMYKTGFQHAMAFALANESSGMVAAFLEHQAAVTPRRILYGHMNSTSTWGPMSPVNAEPALFSGFQTEPTASDIASSLPLPITSEASGPSQISATYSEGNLNAEMPVQETCHGPSSQPNHHVSTEKEMKQDKPIPRSAHEDAFYKVWRKQCRTLVLRLEKNLQRLDELRVEDPDPHFDGLTEITSSMAEKVWTNGVQCFRNIVENSSPIRLEEVVQCLLVADALMVQFSTKSHRLEEQFINDLGRWKSILDEKDHGYFDKVAIAIWGSSGSDLESLRHDQDTDLYHFQGLIQNLVCSTPTNKPRLKHSKLTGKHIGTIQKQMLRRLKSDTSARPVASGPPSASFDSTQSAFNECVADSGSHRDTFDLGDFLHLDELHGNGSQNLDSGNGVGDAPATLWKDISSRIVLLLASVAFTVVLVAITALRGNPPQGLGDVFDRHEAGLGRSCAIVDSFLGTEPTAFPTPSLESLSSMNEKVEDRHLCMMRARSMSHRYESSSTPSFPSASSTFQESFDSLSSASFSPASPGISRTPDRLPCKSPNCFKTFSNVSNLNKHMREGCPFRERKGYKCRNANCTKVLTTKWYRNTHEHRGCRFK